MITLPVYHRPPSRPCSRTTSPHHCPIPEPSVFFPAAPVLFSQGKLKSRFLHEHFHTTIPVSPNAIPTSSSTQILQLCLFSPCIGAHLGFSLLWPPNCHLLCWPKLRVSLAHWPNLFSSAVSPSLPHLLPNFSPQCPLLNGAVEL